MRVLFLDIDGVLHLFPGGASKAALIQLRRIVAETRCMVVLSSDWRLYGELEQVEKDMRAKLGYDGPPLYGCTPDLMGPGRGLEIAAWLAMQPEIVQGWAVVDDRNDEMACVQHRLVQTVPSIGLDETAADRLIELLKAC